MNTLLKLKKGLKKPSLFVFHGCIFCSRFIKSDELYLKILYRMAIGKKLDLKNPKTFTEKIQWLKLHNTSEKCTQLVDKYSVRDWVKDKIGEEFLIPLIGVWENVDDIDFDSLPNQFVLKATHDSGSVIICKNKKEIDIEAAKKKLRKCLQRNYFYVGREYPYKNVKPRIIAEEFMSSGDEGDLSDYKFFCFNGVPKVLFFASDRFNKQNEPPKFDYYDMQLMHLPIKSLGHNNSDKYLSYFPEFDIMKECAAKLSEGFAHVRVDFYLIKGRVYFGEITFHHDGGFDAFEPAEWDKKFGDMIKLPINI